MDNRFEIVNSECTGSVGGLSIFLVVLRDKQSGVMYVADRIGNAGGITPLLDKDGKPITTYKVNI